MDSWFPLSANGQLSSWGMTNMRCFPINPDVGDLPAPPNPHSRFQDFIRPHIPCPVSTNASSTGTQGACLTLHCIGRRGQPGRNEWRSGAAAASKPFNQPTGCIGRTAHAAVEKRLLRCRRSKTRLAAASIFWGFHFFKLSYMLICATCCGHIHPLPKNYGSSDFDNSDLTFFSLSIFDSWECEEATWRGWEGGYKDDCVCPATFKLDPPTMYATFTTASYI